MSFSLARAGLLIVTTLLLIGIAQAQTLKIDKIEFEGLKDRDPAELVTRSELKPGDTFSLPALDAAAQRLMDSGFFTKLSYKTKATKGLISITFAVEEAKVESSPVVFDNFIWFSDTELLTAIQRDLPTFTGTIPDTGDTIDKVIKSLQRFLHENKLEATVTQMTSQGSPGGSFQEHVFSVNGIPMPMCSIHFPGFEAIDESRLIEKSKPLRGDEYSAKFVSSFIDNNLLPLYYEKGHLKAKFVAPQAKPEESATCKNGVEITVPVYEGAVYNFEKAEWTGVNGLTTQELDAALDMKTGEVANGLKIASADRAIIKAYGRKGYLNVSIRRIPQFSDESRKVIYTYRINEGPQFRMGAVVTKGFTEAESKQIQEKWGLKTGAVFDMEYGDEFSKKHLGEIIRARLIERQQQGKTPPTIKTDVKLNREALTVDLVMELTN